MYIFVHFYIVLFIHSYIIINKYKEEEILYGEKIKEITVNNENFKGWYTDTNYTNKYNFNNEVTKDLILYGKIENNKKYTVTFKDQGNIWEEQEIKEGDPAKEPEKEPTKEGHTFKCWQDEKGEVWDFDNPILNNLTLTSCYEKKEYTVKFYNYENKVIKTQTIKYQETINTEDIPTLEEEGYTFTGWFELLASTPFDFNSKITRNIKLYPKHQIIENAVIFNDENKITTQNVEYGSKANEINPLGKAGYTFKYWSTSLNGLAFDFNTEIKETTTLYAVYEINKYTVTFINENETYNTQTINYNENIENVTNPVKTGYTFKYWSKEENGIIYDLSTKVTEDVTLYAVYEINKYTVTFMDGENIFRKVEVEYNNKVEEIKDVPSKEYHIFKNWTLNNGVYDFNSKIIEDITLYSSYEEIESPIISHTPTEWTKDNVLVTITSNHDDYTYMYQIDDGDYKEYTESFIVDKNSTVTAMSVKNNVRSKKTEHIIDNIDKIKPTITNFEYSDITSSSFDINISAIDYESGLKEIDIYKNDVLDATIVYNENVNEEKTYKYTFNNLAGGTTYNIKVKVFDAVGNMSETKDLDVTTTQDIIVARIIGRNDSLYTEESDYENFDSLEKAVNACGENQCTVQMVLDTDESVDVLEGQNITLDLNGKNVTGVRDYTIYNTGEFIITDNSDEVGKIINITDTAIKNEGILQLGINEDTPNVSIEKPNIIGTTYGIYTYDEATLKFYDGKIEGNVAVQGIVDDTPYLYNATVNTVENKQIAILKILEDAEARIGSVYYSKISQALDDAENGYYVENETEATLLTGFKSSNIYGFSYNEEDKSLQSNNNLSATTAESYTIIDLRNYSSNQELTITGYVNSNLGQSRVEVSELDTNKKVISSTTKTANFQSTDLQTEKFILEYGKMYYVKLYNFNNGSTNTETDRKFTITNITLSEYKLESLNVSNINGIETSTVNYGFDYDEETNTLRSNNQYTKNSTAFSYFEVDLTNEEDDYELIINASLDTLYYDNRANIFVSEDNSMKYYYSQYAFAYMYNNGISNIGPRNYAKTLTHGKKYYIQFYYFKGYDPNTEETYISSGSKDQFIINTIDVVKKSESTPIDLEYELKTSGNLGFTEYNSANNSYSLSSLPSNSYMDSYIKIDLTNSNTDQYVTINEEIHNPISYIYLTDNRNNLSYSNLATDKSKLLFYHNNQEGTYYIDGYSMIGRTNDYKFVLTKGNIYYLHIADYNDKSYSDTSTYLKSVSLTPITDSKLNIGDYKVSTGTEEATAIKKDYIIDETEDENFRYIGSNPKNYVNFNDELWRIIGIFETEDANGNIDKRIKLVRNDSIGNYPWDISSSSVNEGYGINEWSTAALMKLLNPGYNDEEVGGSLYYNSSSGTCYSGEHQTSETTSCDFTNTGLKEKSKTMIDEVVWNTGAYSYNNLSGLTPLEMYEIERGNTTGKTEYLTSYENLDAEERTTTWLGKVAVPYPSDYILAMEDHENYSSTWFYKKSGEQPQTMLSPMYSLDSPPFYVSYVAASNLGGMPASYLNYIVRPTVYLSPYVQIKSGKGTQSNPYIFELSDEKNTQTYYGLDPELLKDDESKENIITYENKTNDYEKIKKYGDIYGFTFDSESNTFTNDNKNIPYSLSVSYVKIDLTTESKPKDIIIDYSLQTSSTTSYAYITLMEDELSIIDYNNYNATESLLTKSNANTSGTTIKKTLEAGKIYYLQFAYYKQNADTNEDTFNISLSYPQDTPKTDEYLRYDETVAILNEKPTTIEMLKNIMVPNSLNIEETKNVTLDLRGYTLTTTAKDYVIKNNGSLKVIDSVYPAISDNTGIITSSTSSTILNNGNATLNIENATVSLTKQGINDAITNYGNLYLGTNTQVKATGSRNTAINNASNNSSSTICSKLISSSEYGIYNSSNNNIVIDIIQLNAKYGIYNLADGNINAVIDVLSSTGTGIWNTGTIDVTIDRLSSSGTGIDNRGSGLIDATITLLKTGMSNSYGVYNDSQGIVHLRNSALESAGYGIYNNGDGVVNLLSTNVTVTRSGGYGVYNVSTGIINIEDAKINLSSSITSDYGIYAAGNGEINFKSGTITGYSYGIYNNASGLVNVINGQITATNSGIYNKSNGQIDIGLVDESKPKIIGDLYGIYNIRGILNVNNAYISQTKQNGAGIYNDNKITVGKINITNSEISATGYKSYGVHSYTDIDVVNSTITGVDYGLYCDYNSTNINGGTITSSNKGSRAVYIENGNIENAAVISDASDSYALYVNGTVDVSNVIISSVHGTGINISGTLNMLSGNISASTGISIERGTLNMSSGNIDATYGLTLNKGLANIIDGTIKGSSYGIRGSDKETSYINLGTKDGNANISSPKIMGNESGIYAPKTFINFYDGIITGPKKYKDNISDSNINAIISDSEEDYDLYFSTNSDNSKLEDITLAIPTIEKFGEVAEVDGVTYPSVKSAFDSIISEDNKTIRLLKSSITILDIGSSDKDISINTNGYYIKYLNDETYIINNNNLKIVDELSNSYDLINGISSKYATIVDNFGNLNTQSSKNTYLYIDSTNYAIINNSDSIVYINSDVNTNGYSINNNSNGNVNINSGNITGVITNENGIITVNGGSLSNSNNGKYSIKNTSGTINILGGKISNGASKGYAIYSSSGNVNVDDGGIYGANGTGIYNGGKTLIKGGTVTGSSYGIYSPGDLTINAGIISSTGQNGDGILIGADSVTNIYGGKILSEGKNGIAIYNVGQTNIQNVTISSTGLNSKGIYVSNGTVNLGIKGDVDESGNLIVSKELPKITSLEYGVGVSENGTFNFYDGIITGKTSISGKVNEIEDNYEIILENDTDSNEIKYLGRSLLVKNTTTDEKYYTLQDAVDEASTNDTLQLIRSATILSSGSTIQIASDKSIILDINSHKLSSGNSLLINNNGKLKIIDSSSTEEDGNITFGDGLVETTGESLIENNGTLEIDNLVLSGNNNTESVIINNEAADLEINNISMSVNNSRPIYNSGNATINNIELSGDTISDRIIYNDLSGIMIINGSTLTNIQNNSAASMEINNSNVTSSIYNSSSGDINLTDCTVSSVSNSSGNINIVGGEINNQSSQYTLFNSTGNISVSNSSIINSYYYYYSSNEIERGYAIYNSSSGNIIIDNSTINSSEGYGIYNKSTGTININSATISSEKTSLLNDSSGIINIGNENDDNDIRNDLIVITNKVDNTKDGIINVYYGTLSNVSNSKGAVNVYNGEVNSIDSESGTVNIYNGKTGKITSGNSGIIDIYGGTIESETDAIINRESSTTNIRNANIIGSITNSGIVNMYSGSVKSTSTSAVYNYSTLNIYSGTIESASSHGIDNISSSSVVNLGTKGDLDDSGNIIVSTETPIIKGKDYGIYNLNSSGLINFYDGKIIGLSAIEGSFNEIETDYDTKITTDEDNNEVIYLAMLPFVKNLTTNVEYTNLQQAINESTNGDTLQFIRDKIYPSNSQTTENTKNLTIDLNGKLITSSLEYYLINNGELTIIDSADNGKISSSKTSILNNNKLYINSGILESTPINGTALINSEDSNVEITGGNIKGVQNDGYIKINGGNIERKLSNSAIVDFYSGTISNVNSQGTYYSQVEFTMYGGTITGGINSNKTLNIYGGDVKNSSGSGITNSGTLIIGEQDGVVSTTSPNIQGSTYGLYNSGRVYFYDGIISSAGSAISGTITSVESGYKLNSITNDGVNSVYLVQIGEDERVASVNGINFTSLQDAINSVEDNKETTITLHVDYTLESDINVPANKIINIDLNSHTINYNNYSFTGNGKLKLINGSEVTNILASIVDYISDALNISEVSKNIIVYEMKDGSNLKEENTYKLYKLINEKYEIIKLQKEEEIGNYKVGKDIEQMRTVKNRLYINGLSEGNYKVVDNENKEISFTISSDGKISNNIKDNTNATKYKKIATATAELILMIQTGIIQSRYLILIILIIIILLLILMVKKQRKEFIK